MGILNQQNRPVDYIEEINGPFPRTPNGSIETAVAEVTTPSGNIPVATNPGDTVEIEGDVGVTGTVDVSGSDVTVSNTVSVTGSVSITGPVDVSGSDVDINVGGVPVTGSTAMGRTGVHVVEMDSSGNLDPPKNVNVRDGSGVAITSSSNAGIQALDMVLSANDGTGDTIGSSTAGSLKGVRVFQVNTASGSGLTFTALADQGGGGQGASVLAQGTSTWPGGAGFVNTQTFHRGRIQDAGLAGRYVAILASRDTVPSSSTDYPMLVQSVPFRRGGDLASANFAGTGDTNIIAGLVGVTYHIRKIHARLQSGAANTNVKFRFGTGTYHFDGQLRVNTILEINFPPDALWQGGSGQAFVLNSDTASDVHVTILYDTVAAA